MLIDYQLGQTGIILRVKVRQDTTGATPGKGMTGLTNSSSGLTIGTIADGEAASTAYVAGTSIDTIATLGTYVAPAANHCAFREVDPANHKGVYEIQLANARYAVAGAKSLLVSLSGASGMADCDVCVPLRSINPYDAAKGGMTNLDTTISSRMATFVLPTNFSALAIAPSTGLVTFGNTSIATVTNPVTLAANQHVITDSGTITSVTNPVTLAASQHVITDSGTITNVTNGVTLAAGQTVATVTNVTNPVTLAAGQTVGTVTNPVTLAAGQTVATVTNPVALPTIPTGWITATGIAAAALNGKGDWLTVSNLPANFSSMVIDNNGKLTLTQNFPTYFANMVISAAGLVSSNAAQINGVPTNSVTVVGANIGTTQPINFTGTGSSALVNSSASTVTSNVTIGGYAPGQDPASYVLRSPASKLNTDVNGNVQLAPAGLDLIETEVGITPSTAVVDDNGTQLSAINARQALALCQSLLAGILTGANLNAPLFRAVGNTAKVRLSGVSDISGNRTSATVTLPP